MIDLSDPIVWLLMVIVVLGVILTVLLLAGRKN